MVNFGSLAADRLVSLGHPGRFQPVSHLGFVTAATSLNRCQANFARFWPSPARLHYIYIFGGCCPVTEFCQVQNSLCVLQVLRSPIGSVTARQPSSGREPNCGVEHRAPPIFGRATITLGIGPHSSIF